MKPIFTLLTALSALLPFTVRAADTTKPNVLLLVIDDLNSWLLGDTNRYAGKVIAPNIQRLAASGVVFNRAYTAAPVCCPSRTAMLSGVRPWQSGLYDNGLDSSKSDALKQATAWPAVFKTAGYYVASYGKVGHGWGDMRKMWDDHKPHKRDPIPPGAPFLPFTRGEQDWGPTHLPEEKMNDTSYADAAIAQLQKQHDRPFLVACGLFHPHMPWYVPQKYFDMFPLDEVALPPILKNDLDDVPPLGVALTEGKAKFVDQVIEGGFHKEAVRAYLAATAYADAQMGRVLDALEKSPYRDNTMVMLMSDHGFHLGEKHRWQKSTLWEEATHCLLMCRAPGTTKPGGKCERFVSLQDVYRTLTELSGLKAPDYVEGRSLVPLLKQPDAAWESSAITCFGDSYTTLRNERFRYIRYREGQEEFYDCAKDPHEWTNQIKNPDFAAAIADLRSKLPPQSKMVPQLKRARGGKDDE
jgi:arylsulfatase A-like enzyme